MIFKQLLLNTKDQLKGSMFLKWGMGLFLAYGLLMQSAFGQASNTPTNVYSPIITDTYPNLTVTSSTGTLGADHFDNLGNPINSDLTDFSEFSYLATLGSTAWIQVTDDDATGGQIYPAGSYAGVVVGAAGLLDLVVGESVRISTYNGNTEVEFVEYSTLAGLLDALTVIGDGTTGKIGFETTQPFNAIRLTYSTILGVAGAKRVYYAEILTPSDAPMEVCNVDTPLIQDDYPAIVEASTDGSLVSLLDDVDDIENIVDSDDSNFAQLDFGASVGGSVSISVTDIGQTFPGNQYFAGFEISNSTLLGVDLLAGIEIATYLDGSPQESFSGNDLILGVPLLNSSDKQTVGFLTGDTFDEIEITINEGLLGLDLGTTNVYNAIVKRFCEGTLECGSQFLNNPDFPMYVVPERTGVDGVACVGCSVDGADNAISPDDSDFATLSTTAGVLASTSLSVGIGAGLEDGAGGPSLTDFPSGSFAGFIIEDVTGFLEAELLDALEVCTYNDGVEQECMEIGDDLLRISLRTPLLGTFTSDHFAVGFETSFDYDEIQITYGSVVSADALEGDINVYGAFVENYVIDGDACTVDISLNLQECFRLLSSPLEGLQYDEMLAGLWTQGVPGSSYPPGPDANIFSWNLGSSDNAATNWDPLADMNTEIPLGTGFLISVFADDDFDGTDDSFPKTITIPTGPQPSSVTLNTANGNINTNSDGWTLAGNPYQYNIDINEFVTNELTGSYYVYDTNANGLGNPGEWVSNAGGFGDLVDDAIAVGQGFFIQNEASVSDPSLTIPGVVAMTSDGDFYGKENQRQDYVRLEMKGQEINTSAWVRFSNEGSFEKVYGDALQLTPFSEDYAILASQKSDELMDIGHYPFTTGTNSEIEIPVYAESTKPGSYTITATEMDLPADMPLYLKDLQTGESVEITDNFEYTFEINQVAAKQSTPDQGTSCSDIREKPAQAKAGTSGPRFMVTSSGSSQKADVPSDYKLEQNYPNPFNPATNISYQLPQQTDVSLQVFDITGRHIATLVEGTMPAGSHTVNFNASNLSSGVYFYKLQAEGINLTRKFTLIK